MNAVQRRIAREFEAVSGRHDDPALYGGPAGDPGLIGPDSISWEINGDLASIALAGQSAIVLEILHPSIMAGVQDLSSYREDPFRRARNTLGYVLGTTFGNTEAATAMIAKVRGIHGHINGTRPDGVAYRALDPELLAWVHTTIPWMILRAFERFNRPLTPAQRDRYLTEQSVLGRMAGAETVPETMAELEDYVEQMRGQMAVTEQTRAFFAFLLDSPMLPSLPEPADTLLHQLDVRAGMALAPRWARQLAGFDAHPLVRRLSLAPYQRLTALALRYAYGTPPHVRMARERAQGTAQDAAPERVAALAG